MNTKEKVVFVGLDTSKVTLAVSHKPCSKPKQLLKVFGSLSTPASHRVTEIR
jgi:hypothetical protein